MKILIAPDKFKGSLTALQVATAIRDGINYKDEVHEFTLLPLADGGEGTCEILTRNAGGVMRTVQVHDPLSRMINAQYGYDEKNRTAFIEMASASGLSLLKKEEQNPMHTSTFGTGEMILDAIKLGATQLVLGIGGSATNDAGIGLAAALGYEFKDKNDRLLKPVGASLIDIAFIDSSKVSDDVRRVSVIALCDVTNPLIGTSGAAHVYAPQKGASQEEVKMLDRGLRNFAEVALRTFSKSVDFPGAGAGGGIAGGAKAFLNLEVISGMAFVTKAVQLEDKIQWADLIITGEGKIDRQTLSGKVVASVAELASKHRKRTIAFCGICELRTNELNKIGISEIVSLTDPFTSLETAIRQGRKLLIDRAQNLVLNS